MSGIASLARPLPERGSLTFATETSWVISGHDRDIVAPFFRHFDPSNDIYICIQVITTWERKTYASTNQWSELRVCKQQRQLVQQCRPDFAYTTNASPSNASIGNQWSATNWSSTSSRRLYLALRGSGHQISEEVGLRLSGPISFLCQNEKVSSFIKVLAATQSQECIGSNPSSGTNFY